MKARSLFITVLYAACTLGILLCASAASADPVYRWEDRRGALQFGTKPPRGAKNVKKLSAPKFSRYSTDKVLANYGSRGSLGSSNANTLSAEDLTVHPAATLSNEPVSLERDESGAITSLLVHVVNESQYAASGIRVAFSFADGSIVPASGATSLAAQSRGQYSVPATQLPITTPADEIPGVRIIQEEKL